MRGLDPRIFFVDVPSKRMPVSSTGMRRKKKLRASTPLSNPISIDAADGEVLKTYPFTGTV